MENKATEAKKSRAKYITLAVLVVWVVGVFVFTFFKLPGGLR
jgi:beta-lactamase regulating signal transducer with metallopeptidase domain